MKNSAEVESSDNADDDQFEFWMVGNPLPSFPQPHHLLTADQLFADGIILPLHSLTVDDHHNASLPTHPPPSPLIPPSCSGKKWKHINIFASRPKRNNCKAKIISGATAANITATTTTTTADQLNIIHIWPFSRSRSAGNTLPRPTLTTSTTRFQNYVKARAIRKSSSAPCSRSNSRGDQEAEAEPEPEPEPEPDAEAEEESSPKTNTSAAAAPPPKKKWGPLVGVAGVRVGRSMPVWQLRRGGNSNGSSNSNKGMLNHLNVNTCIGYGATQVSSSGGCGGEDKDEVTGGEGNVDGGGSGGGGGGDGGGGSGVLFNLKGIFSKKVY